MKKSLIFMFSFVLVFAGCSNDELVNDSVAQKAAETPIGFNVKKQNITRSTALETLGHYNFGVWAYKGNDANTQLVMANYLVGYSDGTCNGYDKTNGTTWRNNTGTEGDQAKDNYYSPWFYEGLGTDEYNYTGDDGFYKKTDTNYMSNNANQYLRYWDLAYTNTNFYCYAPYYYNATEASRVTFDASTSKMTFPSGSIRDGYDNPQNPDYDNISRSLSEFMYGGYQATNSAKADVDIAFKHMGAQLYIRFYEAIPGYRVEIIDLNQDRSGYSADERAKNGIQAKPATRTGSGTYTYAAGGYYTQSGAVVDFSSHTTSSISYSITNPEFKPSWSGEKATTPLKFKVPTATGPTSATKHALDASWLSGHNVIPQDISNLTTQTYAYSPTIYYPVAQPTTDTPSGFTFHVSYRVIAEDNHEIITVHDARVFVPAKGNARTTESGSTTGDQWITAWQANTKYTYTFKIIKGTSGTTDPNTTPNPDAVDPGTEPALYPIVFDNATIEEYTENISDYNITDGTSY